jgi:uncharacterized protein YlxW (UPF0749 family)
MLDRLAAFLINNKWTKEIKTMKKHGSALFAAFLITLIVGVGMFVIGGNAIITNSVTSAQAATSSNSAQTAANSSTANTVTVDAAQLQQLQNLVSQYQQREQQYQQQLSDAQQQINQANQSLQQYQQLLEILVSRGIIQVDQQGRIYLPRN